MKYDPVYFANNGMISGDLVISLEVIFHLVKHEIFINYIQGIFSVSINYAVMYLINFEEKPQKVKHFKHREFTKHIDEIFLTSL